jgi:predicted amino acid-binding ACT domain protein
MVKSKIRFIVQDLPKIDATLSDYREQLKRLLFEEAKLSAAITKSDSFDALDQLITMLNSKYQTKGEYENILRQLSDVESKLMELNKELATIDNDLFSDEFAIKIKEQINKFNRHFSAVSYELYGEKYALKVDTKIVKGRRLYEFTSFNTNFSSGKKQGEISCFDIAYTLFADEENIPCMHFLLNDKKELMHDNQLLMIANFVNVKGIQFVASILKDKLPEELNKPENIVLKLSQEDKLFRIENGS